MPTGNKTGVVVYALCMVAVGLFHRHSRWFGIRRGEKWHTYSTGISYLEKNWLKLPEFFHHERRIHRFLDPILTYLIASIFWLPRLCICSMTTCQVRSTKAGSLAVR